MGVGIKTMRMISKIGGLVVFLLVAACAPRRSAQNVAAPSEPHVHHVVLITVDGLLPEAYLHPETYSLQIPTLEALMKKGATSDGALSVYPTLTYPSHTSMVTGVNPGKHGVVGNKSFDPYENDLDGWRWYAEDIKRDPIWRVASRAGYSVATIHWPVTVGAEVTWRVPEYWRAKNEQDKKLVRAVSTPGLLERVAEEKPDFWSRFVPPNVHDDALTDIAVHLIKKERPNLLLLHLVEVDGEQHGHGLFSKEALQAIENSDRQLGRIVEAIRHAGIENDTSIIVASDHGFMNAGMMVRPGVLLRQSGLVTMKEGKVGEWKATMLNNSGHAYFYLNDPQDRATGEALRKLFESKSKEAMSGIGRIYSREEVVQFGGDPTAYLAVEASPGFQFGSGFAGEYNAPPVYKATHGYDPRRPELKASLIIAGPNVKHGALKAARLIDIGPTIASWLSLSLPNTDGSPLRVSE